MGRVYYNRTESVPDPRPGRSRQVPRAREDWIEIPVPVIIAEDVFDAAGRVSRDNLRDRAPVLRCDGCAILASSQQIRPGDR